MAHLFSSQNRSWSKYKRPWNRSMDQWYGITFVSLLCLDKWFYLSVRIKYIFLNFNLLLMDFNSVIICKCICFSLNSYRYSLLPLCWFYMKKKLKYAKKKNVYWVLLSMHKYYALGQPGGWKTSSISFHKSPCCVNSFVKLSNTKWNLISFIWHFGFKKIKRYSYFGR